MVSCINPPQGGELYFVLKEADNGTGELYRIPLPLKTISDFNRYCFFFPPIKDSKDKHYIFFFDTLSQEPGKNIALWYDTSDAYHDGSLQINNTPSGGDLYFHVYCFTGLQPVTDWQGRRALPMDQGWYITIRELQFYYEQSPAFRATTETHTKLQRLKKALSNRKSLTEFGH